MTICFAHNLASQRRWRGFVAIGAAVGAAIFISHANARPSAAHAQLTQALAQQNLDAINAAVAAYTQQLGNKAGVPEIADRTTPIPATGKWLTAQEAQHGFTPWFKLLESKRWWKIGLDPAQLKSALREPAEVISGSVAVARAGLDGATQSRALAKEAADFLVWAQAQGGAGLYPFPAARGVSRSGAFGAADRYLARAQKEGRLEAVVTNGWAINDDGDGGLQFDNGECGVALLELYALTQENKYLQSALRAADWALARPLVPNWNYNSFSVHLLAAAFQATGEPKYLDGAINKALLGVIPGQLIAGPNAGRWVDAHNARPAYHYIMLRALAELAVAMPKNHAARPAVMRSLRLGLLSRNQDLLEKGAATKDKAIEALLFVNRAFADDTAFLQGTRSAQALDALARLVSAQAQRGHVPLGPRAWGQFLAYAARRGGS